MYRCALGWAERHVSGHVEDVAITLGSNIPSLGAQRRLEQNSSALSKVFARLSSGMRITSASDDAAGLSVAANLNAHARIFTQAVRNANDGLSALSIADSALGELTNVVTRIQELATQAASGIYSTNQRTALDNEAQQLSAEYSRILQTTQFNGQTLLNGSLGTVALQVGADGSSNSQIRVALGSLVGSYTGTGSFGSESIYSSSGVTTQVTTGDFNGDGKADIASASGSGGGTVVYFGNGDGTFGGRLNIPDGATFGIAAGDLNRDGYSDIVVGGGLAVYFGSSNGTFSGANLGGTGDGSVLVDVNGDQSLDIVYNDAGSGVISVMLNNGNGTFQAHKDYTLAGIGGANISSGDFNGDGRTDIVVSRNSAAMVFLGNSNGSFAAAQSYYAIGSNVIDVKTADFNGDGRTDILMTGQSGYTELLIANSDGTFKAATPIVSSVDNDGGTLATGDFNGDGFADYARFQSATGLTMHLGNGDGTFRAGINSGVTSSTARIAAGDLNGDGVLDIVAGTNLDGNIGVFLQASVYSASLQTFSLRTATAARTAIDSMSSTITQLAQARGTVGVAQQRLNTAISNLQSETTAYRAAEGRIMDADIAQDSAELIRRQILQQTGASVLAQANQEPALALKLLRG